MAGSMEIHEAAIRFVLRATALPIALAGRKYRLAAKLSGRLCCPRTGHTTINVPEPVRIDRGRHVERILLFAFCNLLRAYSHSPLGRIVACIEPKGLFVDIGANLGFYSFLAARRGFQTHLFEPEPGHFEFLKRNRHLFHQIYQFALSDEEGEARLFLSKNNPGGHSLVQSPTELDVYHESVKVRVCRFDQAVDLNQDVALVKIDVEGNEFMTVQGMAGLFDHGQRPVLWIEVRNEQSPRNPGSDKKVLNYLKNYGYRPYIYDRELRAFDPSSDPRQVYDLLFLQDGYRHVLGC